MLDLQEFLWGFSILSLLLCSVRGLTKALHMPLSLYSPSSSGLTPHISWVRHLLHGTTENPSNASALLEPQQNANKTSPLDLVRDQPQEIKKSEKLKEGSDSLSMVKAKGFGPPHKLRKRPAKLVVPEYCPALEFSKLRKKIENQEFQVQGRDYCLATKKGRRETLEDAYGVMLDILGDSKQVINLVINFNISSDSNPIKDMNEFIFGFFLEADRTYI